MNNLNRRLLLRSTLLPVVAGLGLVAWTVGGADHVAKPGLAKKAEFETVIQPLLQKYCLNCHSTKAKKGSLDLERFASLAQVRKDLKPWQQMIEMLETLEMPP